MQPGDGAASQAPIELQAAAAQFADESPVPLEESITQDVYFEVDRQTEAGRTFNILSSQGASPTEVMVAASGLLKAANLAVFELGMWQSWTGR